MKQLLGMLALVISGACAAMPVTGKVIHVEDGDTVTFRSNDSVNFVVRIADIDAPETCHRQHDPSCRAKPGQPFARRAAEQMKRLTLGKEALAECQPNPDLYGRRICSIIIDGSSIGPRVVELGYAWLYRTRRSGGYAIHTGSQDLIAIESKARIERRGLWALPNPIYPGEWRKACWEQHQCAGASED